MTGTSPSAAIESTAGAGVEASLGARSTKARVAHFLQRDGIGAFVVLVVIAVVASATIEGFGAKQNAANILSTAALPAIIAIGMTMVIITGGIDLSVGSVFAFSAILVAKAVDPKQGMGLNLWEGVGLALGAALLIGLVQGLLIARTGMPPFIVTLAGLYAVRGLVFIVSNEGGNVYSVEYGGGFYNFAQASVFGIGVPVLAAIILFLVWHVILSRTSFGLTTYALGGSESSASLMGLKVRSTKVKLYVISAGLAGVAGVLNTAYSQSGIPLAGNTYELNAIAAVVIGGTLLTGGAGSLIGTAAGVLLLATASKVINLGTNYGLAGQQVLTGGFLVAVVILQRYLNRVQRR